jgi:MraZ protein
MVQGAAIEFTGEARHTLDDKGRLTLPGPVRDALRHSDARDLWLGWMPGDGCVNVYPKETMAVLMAEWEDPARFASTRQHTDFLRLFRSRLEIVTPDKNDRILIPPAKRELAGIRKEVVVAAAGFKFELWDPEAHQAKIDKSGLEWMEWSQKDGPEEPAARFPRC